jgi:hypothetical protein
MQANANNKTPNFKTGLNLDFSGANWLNNSKSAKTACLFLFQNKLNRKSATIMGNSANK